MDAFTANFIFFSSARKHWVTVCNSQASCPFPSFPFLSLSFPSFPFLALPFPSFPFLSRPFPSCPFRSLPFPSFPFLSLPFPSFPFLSLPFPSFPFLSLPFPSFPFLSLPFPCTHTVRTPPFKAARSPRGSPTKQEPKHRRCFWEKMMKAEADECVLDKGAVSDAEATSENSEVWPGKTICDQFLRAQCSCRRPQRPQDSRSHPSKP